MNSDNYIQKKIDNMCLSVDAFFSSAWIDYYGCNINMNGNISLKIYLNVINVLKRKIRLLDKMMALNIMGEASVVLNEKKIINRFDIALRNRNNHVMQDFFKLLYSESDIYRNNCEEIEILSKMKVSENKDLQFAALYYFGFTYEKTINALKFHYVTRNIDEQTNFINNKYYLLFMKNLKITEFEILCCVVEECLNSCDGNLWMLAVDYFQDQKKYKIYIETNDMKVLDFIKMRISQDTSIKDSEKVQITEQMKKIVDWVSSNEKKFKGVAFCLDTQNNVSYNFYCKETN